MYIRDGEKAIVTLSFRVSNCTVWAVDRSHLYHLLLARLLILRQVKVQKALKVQRASPVREKMGNAKVRRNAIRLNLLKLSPRLLCIRLSTVFCTSPTKVSIKLFATVDLMITQLRPVVSNFMEAENTIFF